MPSSTAQGFGRVLVAVYAVFAIAATARSAVQIATRYDEAPLAYLLSAFAGLVYVVATIALALGHNTTRRIAYVAILIELAGVLCVGTLSIVEQSWFPDATVWSDFGQGYGYVPLALPFVGLWWLRHTSRSP